jgi:hypothetical protein
LGLRKGDLESFWTGLRVTPRFVKENAITLGARTFTVAVTVSGIPFTNAVNVMV